MKIILNKKVVVTLQSGVSFEGILTEWNENRAVFVYDDNNNYTIILKPLDSIVMINVYGQTKAPHEQHTPSHDEVFNTADIQELPTSVIHNKISEFLTNNNIKPLPGVKFDTPNFTKRRV